MNIRPHSLTRLDAALAALTFVATLALYVRTLAPGLLLGDSAEFQTLAYTLGMTHPTGYPVYVLMARLFTLLPFGDLAYRVNLFSAVMASLALALIYLAGRLLQNPKGLGGASNFIAALAGPLALSIVPVFWMHAVIAELYAPAAACLAGLIVLILLWRQSGDWRYLAGAGLLGGLSLGVHNTVALAAPAVLAYLALTARTRRAWLGAVIGGFVGAALALIAFLALDAYNAPPTYYNATARHALSVWGLSAGDFDSPFERLNFLYAAKQFRPFMFANPAANMPANAQAYWEHLNEAFAPLTVALMMLGVAALFKRRWREGILLGLAWATQFAFVTNYDVGDIQVFYIPGFVILTLFVGAGSALVLDLIAWLAQRRPHLTRGAAGAASAAGLVLLAGLPWPLTPVIQEAWAEGRATFIAEGDFADYPYPVHDPEYPREDALALVEGLEDNAIVFTGWDMLYPYYFVAHVEQGRTGLAFHETYPQDGVMRLADSTLAYIEANIDTRPIYFSERPSQLADKYKITRTGSGLFRIERK